jgi:hypothetical protein
MKLLKIPSIIIIALLMLYSCELIDDNPGSGSVRDRIEGQWRCDENSQIYKSTQSIYWVYIDPDLYDSTRVIISNFYNLGNDIYVFARVNNYNLSIYSQITDDGYTILSGSGTISSNYKNISWTYKVDDGSGEIDNVTATYTRD